MLERVLGEKPEGLERITELLRRAAAAAPWPGRPIFAGLRSLGFPGSYPQRIAGVYNVGGGPHFGSGLTMNTAAKQYENKA